MKHIVLNGEDLGRFEEDAMAEMISTALENKGISAESFAWSIEVQYTPAKKEPT